MRGENAGVLDAFSDVSESSDSDEEILHVMDPSDPRAHRPAPSVVQPTRVKETKTPQNQATSRWDSDDDVGEPISVDSDSENQKTQTPIVIDDDDAKETPKPKIGVTLSKWAQARFLVPASQRKIPMFEEPPLEPLNDFILSDFSSRHRGNTGDVEVEKEIKLEDEEEQAESNKMQVGVPLFDTNSNDKEKEDESQDETKPKEKKKKKKEDGRKRKENRYFITDLATKCFHCGEVGHVANVCMNDKLQNPCHYCALRGHQAWECPNLPCANCLQLGHQERDCNNRTVNIDPCSICGRPGHIDEDCDNVGDQAEVTCMVCTQVGHLHCVPIPPPADRRVYCPNCAENHTLDRCRTYMEPAATNFAKRTASGRTVQTCFVCNEAGHIAAECPVRSNGYGRGGGNCFKCGKPGHFAADCYDSGRRVTGRKRGRDVEDEYPDYNGYDYDEDEDYYSYDRSSKGGKKHRNRGGSSRARNFNKGYARLNEALPTRPYRNNNSYGERRRNSRR
ncbi:hypothetical protein F441_06844 [Phytophthora nicotianae CJ01A1]|uniref:CCHC-type domain-containing protein n=2 Tax=Phytophthora nicotianae TaxID=4792 RepID=W2RFN0_PHYN3|nr:hypothetical protein PPTG_02923 [Phytophthora nicotianae INRA-310]ETN23320.1 hypothetical protein PPTG_02923 [Phytophthora nicotianae INRA-310]ETP19008.1 hypothetical protein F441_06844 [Phytophthora nicotianae CJ01A1]